MKRKEIKYIVCILIGLQLLSGTVVAQNLPRETIVTHLSERYLLAGENLWFSVLVSSQKEKQISNLAFVELVDASNRAVARKKILLKNGVGEGLISLSDSLSPGVYHLVAYTSWLRNIGAEHFSVSRLLVVQPGNDLTVSKRKEKDQLVANMKPASEKMHIQLSKTHFKSREKAALRFDLSQAEDAIVSVAVRKKEPPLNTPYVKTVSQKPGINQIKYLPDYKGILLSGFVRNKENNKPLINHEIFLSFPGKDVEIKRTFSGADGKFHFLLSPETGEKDMVFTLQSEDAGIWLEERFSENTDFLFPVALELDSNQLNYFTQKFINRQLQEKFRQAEKIPERATEDASDYIFYKEPYQVLSLKDYIQLDSIPEYFYELIPTVHFKRRNNNYQMYLTNPETNYRLGDNPALFIDGVYYPFPGELMKVQPKEVERIEVIPDIYYYRRMTFDGILSVFTKDHDFMDVPLQPNMFRIFYELAAPTSHYVSKEYTKITTDSNLPDLRWLLHWEPQVEIASDKPAGIEFFTSDVTGEFVITVSGITSGGEIITKQQTFTVE